MTVRALKLARDKAFANLHFARRRLSRAADKSEIAEAAQEIADARDELARCEAALMLARMEVTHG